jgi:hypothetical protein
LQSILQVADDDDVDVDVDVEIMTAVKWCWG